ncbi:MAG: hypothetical protein HYZ29_12080 [Myxococcales bacterium]|nr:hypothetical protein [Myxococcales bacterium]
MSRRDRESPPDPEAAEPDALVPLRREGGAPIVSPRLIARVRVVAEALFSTGEGPPPAARLDWLCLEAEDFLARAGARSRFVVGLALFVVGLLAPLMLWRLSPLGRLSVRDRARALQRLEDRFGAPVLAVKAMLCILYYEHPDAAREVGFDGACLKSASTALPGAS